MYIYINYCSYWRRYTKLDRKHLKWPLLCRGVSYKVYLEIYWLLMLLFSFQNSGRGFIFLWSLVWVPIFLWIIIRVEEHTVLSRFLCNVESFRSLYGFATKWKISSIISGDIPYFDLKILVAWTWRFFDVH